MKHTLYTKQFLARRIFSASVLGLDLHEGGISFAALKRSGKGYVLKVHGMIELAADVFGGGMIKNKAKVTQALKIARKKSGLRYVRASIPEEHVYVIDMTLPRSDKKKVIDKITTKLADILPAFSGDMLINYEILSEDAQVFHLNVSIAKKSFVDEYLGLLAEAGFSVVSLEFRSAAIVAALIGKNDMTPKLVACLEHARLSVFGAAAGFILAGYVSEIDASRDFLLIKEKIDRAYIEWCQVQPQQKITEVLLSGSGAREAGLADYLSIGLKMPVMRANVWTNVYAFNEYIPEITSDESMEYAAAIGLALEDFEK